MTWRIRLSSRLSRRGLKNQNRTVRQSGHSDTTFHGYWWRMARRHGPFDVVFAPINGAVVNFPHLQPPSPLAATMGAFRVLNKEIATTRIEGAECAEE